MPANTIELGETFTFDPSGHLWVVISDPSVHAEFVIVNATTDAFRADNECPLDAGCHRRITRLSYITYGDARLVDSNQKETILALISGGTITRYPPMNPTTLVRIIEAGKLSKALAPKFKAYL
jgi:hypothetical protein